MDGSSSWQDEEPVVADAALGAIIDGLTAVGGAVIKDAVPLAILDALRADLLTLDDEAFTQAGVGRGGDWQRTEDIRRDRVHWIDGESAASRWYLEWIESLRLGLNLKLQLGLFDYECHYAWYSPGAFYQAHVDAFHGDDNRKVSTVLYLNEDWQPADGGELVLYESVLPGTTFDSTVLGDPAQVVTPTGGTLVCFLSEEIPHEVRNASANRFSIAGWYRVNSGRS